MKRKLTVDERIAEMEAEISKCESIIQDYRWGEEAIEDAQERIDELTAKIGKLIKK